MQRIIRLDVVDMFPEAPPVLVQVGVAAGCIVIALGLRSLIDIWAPYAGPYAVNMPAFLLATLMGRLPAGIIVLVTTTIMTWYFVLPVHQSFVFEDSADGPRTIVNAVSGLATVLIAELARRAVRNLVTEREARILERDMLLQETDHRVKNNLAMLSAMLAIQRRNCEGEEAKEELYKAEGRVQSLGTAYEFLNMHNGHQEEIELGSFLTKLCTALRNASVMHDHIRLEVSTDEWQFPRDQAGAIGLLVNELITNAIKHAFPGRDGGTITVSLRAHDDQAELVVSDDGVGVSSDSRNGKGSTFIDALAKTAGIKLTCHSDASGTRYSAII